MGTDHYPISDAQRHTYAADGALFLPGVLDAHWLARLRDSVESLEERERRDGLPEGFFDRQRLWEQDEGLRDILFHSPATGIAAQFLGAERLNVLYDQVFIKAPATNVRTPWHNDLPNWPVRGNDLITVWVALDPIDAENGMLEFVRGSHRWGWWTPRLYTDVHGTITHFYIGENETGTQEEMWADYDTLAERVSESELLRWDTEPGDAIVFGAMMVHGAIGNNRPDRKRRAYSMRFAGPDVRYHPPTASNLGIMNDYLSDGDPLGGWQYPVVFQA